MKSIAILICGALACAIASADSGAPRVAVVSDAASKDLAALVTKELSSNAAVSLVERDDLAKIGDEAKVPTPIPWMAADEPIYRNAKGLPGVTWPVPTPWASEAIWDCPPGKQKQMGSWSVGFHDDRLFILTKPSPLENRFELLYYDKPHGRKPVHIPLKLELTEPEKAALSLHPGHMPNGCMLDEIERPPHGPHLLATNQGLCLKLMVAGFWFIPYSDIDAYLKANR